MRETGGTMIEEAVSDETFFDKESTDEEGMVEVVKGGLTNFSPTSIILQSPIFHSQTLQK